jgi:hypothetical protein
MEFLTPDTSTMTDVPSMILHAGVIPYPREAYGVQMAGDWFLKAHLLDQAIAPTLVVCASKDAILVVDDREDPFAGRIQVRESLGLNHPACLFGHLRQELRQDGFQVREFVIGDRTACVALNTTAAAAGVEVATKLLLQDVQRD